MIGSTKALGLGSTACIYYTRGGS